MEEEFKDLIKLDKDKLDDCAVEQIDLYYEWSSKWAESIHERDSLKEKLNIIRSQLDKAIRINPNEYGWESEKAPTEAFINNQIPIQKEYQENQEDFLTAQYNVNVLLVAKETIEQRGKMLNILASLYTSGYFSSKINSVYKEIQEEKATKETQELLAENPRIKERMLKKKNV